jgi:hypothetical protein
LHLLGDHFVNQLQVLADAVLQLLRQDVVVRRKPGLRCEQPVSVSDHFLHSVERDQLGMARLDASTTLARTK